MTDSDVRVYRASEIGGCVKSQVAAHLHYERLATPGRMQAVFDEGTAAEPVVLGLLEAAGWELYGHQSEVSISVTPRVALVGHVDAVGGPPGLAGGVVEVKSMSDGAYADWQKTLWETPGLTQKYKWQLSAYMNGMQMPGWIVAYNRLTGDWVPTLVPEPFVTTGELKARVLEIDRFVRLGELPVVCDVKIWPCPFAYLEEVAYDQDNFEIEDVAVAYKAAMMQEKAGKDAKGKLRKVLDEVTSGASYKSERVTVTYFKRRNPDRLDEKLIVDAGLRVEDFKKDGGSQMQVKVTLHEPGDEE